MADYRADMIGMVDVPNPAGWTPVIRQEHTYAWTCPHCGEMILEHVIHSGHSVLPITRELSITSEQAMRHRCKLELR